MHGERAARAAGPPGRGRDRDGRAGARLTRREAEVLRLVAGGRTTVHIAGCLGIAPSTVESHVRSVRTKLGVPTRTAAAAWDARVRDGGAPGGRAVPCMGGPLDGVAAALLDALAAGRLVADAARDAHVSLRTAHRRLREAREALGATTTAEAVARWSSGRHPRFPDAVAEAG
jgi:DNA-binding CsgD family transcriptional regulator